MGRRHLAAVAAVCALSFACSLHDAALESAPESPFLIVSAGDADEADSDFIIVVDMRSSAAQPGAVLATTLTGLKGSLPHHMEYHTPPPGELLFMNAHHHELTLLVDVSNPLIPRIVRTLAPPVSLRFPHDYLRTPSGTRLVGFLRSEGASSDPDETATPGNFGGIAEYTADGTLLRSVLAGNYDSKPVRPYAFALLRDIDRLVVTSAPMMETVSADVVQIYRYSDLTLLHTIGLPEGALPGGERVEGSQRAGFGPRVLPDGSVFFNSYGCAFYRLSEIEGDRPRLETLFALDTPPPLQPGWIRGSCGIPVVFGQYWLNPVGQLNAVVVLDVSNPSSPKEVFRLSTPETFSPHWLARDPRSNRLVLGAEFGGEEGLFILRFDDTSGTLSFDAAFNAEGQLGYLSLKHQTWPHGSSGPAWAHAALFLPGLAMQ